MCLRPAFPGDIDVPLGHKDVSWRLRLVIKKNLTAVSPLLTIVVGV